MVHMGIGDIAMKAGINRSRTGIEIEGAVIEVVHHLVFLGEVLVETFQGQQLVHVQRGETIELHGGDVTAGALHPQHLHRLLGERIGHFHFG